jgi:hypothetical protein
VFSVLMKLAHWPRIVVNKGDAANKPAVLGVGRLCYKAGSPHPSPPEMGLRLGLPP